MDELKQKVKLLPERPGVYLMKGEDGGIIYIGKAKVLRNRVSQYFVGEHDLKTARMVSNIRDFDFIVTETELEALVLECSLIKHYQPKYNILLKDDKSYPYIKVEISKEYPRLLMTRRVVAKDKNLYFGPYSGQIKGLVAQLCKVFRLPTCSRTFPRDIGKQRPCLHYHTGSCCGVCTGEISKEEYSRSIEKVLSLLKGNYAEVEGELEAKMAEEAEALRFESAAHLRDQLRALRRLTDRQKVVSGKNQAKDVLALHRESDKSCLAVLIIRSGRLIDSHTFIVSRQGSGDDLEQLCKQYYTDKNDIPKRIYLSEELPDRALIAQWLSDRAGQKVHVTIPKQGENLKLVRMAMENASATLEAATTAAEKDRRVLGELQQLLGLQEPPRRIEATDISNLGGDSMVGALVCFTNGRPDRSGYKKFRINSTDGQNDYGAHQELLYRRITRYLEGDASFSPLPDLLLIDGGKGHVSAAKAVCEALQVPIPVFGMVKDSRHRVRGLCTEKEELSFSVASRAFHLIGAISEEVHRSAISYHRQVRGKKAVHSRLLGIEGVGEKRCKQLLAHFKTMENMKQATVEELRAVKGMDVRSARAVWEFFAPERGN